MLVGTCGSSSTVALAPNLPASEFVKSGGNENQLYYPPVSKNHVFVSFSGFCCSCIAGKQEDRGASTPNRSRTLTVVLSRNAEIWFQSKKTSLSPSSQNQLLLNASDRSTIMRLGPLEGSFTDFLPRERTARRPRIGDEHGHETGRSKVLPHDTTIIAGASR
jgi:hypothetical protein